MDSNIKEPPSDLNEIIKIGNKAIIFLVLAFAIMFWVKLDYSVVGVGEVSADIYKKRVDSYNDGIIEKIYVKNGDEVHKGDLLIKLESDALISKLNSLKTQLRQAKATYYRLKAQKEDKEKINFPNDVDEQLKETEINIFNGNMNIIAKQKMVSENKISAFKNQIEGLEQFNKSLKNKLSIVNKEIQTQKELFNKQIVNNIKLNSLLKDKDQLEGQINRNKYEILKLKEKIKETENSYKLFISKYKKSVNEDYAKAKLNLEDIKSKIAAVKEKLKNTELKAPIDGIVIGLQHHTIGAVVKHGENILSIVPKNHKYIIDVRIKTMDIDNVKTGLPADVRILAFTAMQLDILPGKVTYISADKLIDKQRGFPYYKVKVELTDNAMKILNKKKIALIPGMPAQVMIKIGKRSFLEYILNPIIGMIDNALNEE